MIIKQEHKLHYICLEKSGQVGFISMTRDARFNALDVRMAQDLRKAALQLARDDSCRCVVLAGGEKSFCSGADLRYVQAKGNSDDFSYLRPDSCVEQATYGASFKQILEYIHSTISEIRRAPKPFIAAVKGVAAAGGFGIAMSCDLVFASDKASFEWAYPKTGLTGAEGSTFFLPRLVGLRKAFELAFLNPRLTSEEALRAGLITDIFPHEHFDSKIQAIAKQLADGPTQAYGITKRLFNEAAGMDHLDTHLDRELRHLVDIADKEDFSEGLDAFFAKRQPDFQGGTP